jgi:hypothetical protein
MAVVYFETGDRELTMRRAKRVAVDGMGSALVGLIVSPLTCSSQTRAISYIFHHHHSRQSTVYCSGGKSDKKRDKKARNIHTPHTLKQKYSREASTIQLSRRKPSRVVAATYNVHETIPLRKICTRYSHGHCFLVLGCLYNTRALLVNTPS